MKSLLINNLDSGRVFTLSTFDTILGGMANKPKSRP